VKDPDVAIDPRPPPRTEPLSGVDSYFDDFFGFGPLLAMVAVPLLVALVVALGLGLH